MIYLMVFLLISNEGYGFSMSLSLFAKVSGLLKQLREIIVSGFVMIALSSPSSFYLPVNGSAKGTVSI